MACCRAGPVVRQGSGGTATSTFVKRVLVGRPLATTEQEHQRITKTIALAVFSSDAISSTAYATEEILLRHRGRRLEPRARALDTLVPIAIAVASCSRSSSRRTARRSSPTRAAAARYVVSRENLGENPSLVAGASLLVDYILTVAVSISAGVAAIISIPQFARPRRSTASLLGLVLIALISAREPPRHQGVGPHLRGARPTSTSSILGALVVLGLYRSVLRWFGDIHARSRSTPRHAEGTTSIGGTLGLFILLQGLLVGRGRAHRRRGDLQRRARVPAPGVEERGDHARVDGRHPRHAVPRRLGPGPPPAARTRARRRRCSRRWARTVFGSGTVSTWSCSSRPPRSSRSPPTPPTPTSRGCRRSSPATATCRASSRTAATASCSRNGVLVLARRWPACSIVVVRRQRPNALIPLYAVGVFTVVHAVAGGHGAPPPEGARAGLASATS